MSKFAAHAIAWSICIVFALLVGEAYGAVWFYRNHGALIYRSRVSEPKQEAKPNAAFRRVHPYLGFDAAYSDEQTNIFQLTTRQLYKVPSVRGPNDLIVAVFGGSVASNLVNPPQGGLSLLAALQERAELSGKNIVIYSMAQGVAKQPQQVMALAMLQTLGRRADVVLNLDGFNEFGIGYENVWYGTHPIFPGFGFLWQIGTQLQPMGQATEEYYRFAYESSYAKSSIAAASQAADRSTLGLSYLYNNLLISFYNGRLATLEAERVVSRGTDDKWQAVKKLMSLDIEPNDKADPWDELFNIWLRSSDEMAALSRNAGSRYLHVIQPNQYFSKKTFSPDEAKVALSLPAETPVRIGAERGYLMLDQRSELIASRGIISAIGLLDREMRPMYVDNCCHYNKAGETILARFMAGQIVTLIGSR